MMKVSLQQLIESSDLLASEFYNQNKYEECIDQNNITMKLMGERHPSVLKNMSSSYFQMCQVDKSLEVFKEYMSLTNSTDKNDIRQLAQYLTRSNKFDEAYELVKSQNDCLEKHLDIGWFMHRDGRFKEAFIETEIGRGEAFWCGTRLPPAALRWRGESINGKKLCLIGEAGLGDEIIFCRWIKDLKEMGAEVYYYTNNTLKNVIARNFNIRVYDETIRYDYWVPAMSLPYLLQKEEAGNSRYLQPSPIHLAKWKSRLPGKFYVLNWTGERDHMENKFRTIPVEYLIDKLDTDVTLVSVCMSAESCPEGVLDLTKDIESWDDTLAILSLSDKCFTCSSSVSVAAGALGIETHLYDLVVGYFTWNSADNGGLSSWFPNVRVWRQDVFGQWEPVIDKSISFLTKNS